MTFCYITFYIQGLVKGFVRMESYEQQIQNKYLEMLMINKLMRIEKHRG